VRSGFHASSLEAVSEVISEGAATQFSLIVYESTGAVWLTNPFVTYESTFDGFLCVDSVSVFLDSL
jgi:hypothetical protein